MDKISLPTSSMRETGQKMLFEANDLVQENVIRYQHIHSTYERLPASLQFPLDNVLSSLQRNLMQVLVLHQNIGKMLIEAAEISETTDSSLAQGFEGH
jgi:hypothetical protein